MTTSNLVERLVIGADGMFLWASLMVMFLSSPALSPMRRLRTIADVILPEGLEAMYNRTLTLNASSGRTERDLTKRISLWLMLAFRGLTAEKLKQAVSTSDNMDDYSRPDRFKDFEETVTTVCGGLVESFSLLSHDCKAMRGFGFIHLSVREHFMDTGTVFGAADDPLLPVSSKQIGHLQLVTSRLQLLSTDLALQSLDNTTVQNLDLNGRLCSFVSYAAVYWIEHLDASIISDFDAHSPSSRDYSAIISRSVMLLDLVLCKQHVVTSWIEIFYLAETSGSLPLHLIND